MVREWLYFGCHRQAGHYLFRQGMRTAYDRELDRLSHFDGKLPPQDCADGYIAAVSRLEGWGMTALAFWDYSVDKRGGCNSIVFAPSLTITPEDLLAEAQVRFPEVFGRLPQPVRLLAAGVAGTPLAADSDPEKRPDFYTWTWDVEIGGGRWEARYGWKKPPGKVHNLKPLFTHAGGKSNG